MTVNIILYAANILALIISEFVLINYMCRLEIKYSPIKAIIRMIFFFDTWYICWLFKWLYRNPFAIVGSAAITCLLCLIAQMGGLLAQSNVFERSQLMLTASPIAWLCIAFILHQLPKVFPKIS